MRFAHWMLLATLLTLSKSALKDWQPGQRYGKHGRCTSGGFNHARVLLEAFLTICREVGPDRKPFVLSPSTIFSNKHGRVPSSVRWSDLFDWDIDHDDFQEPQQVWNAPGIEVFDVYDNHNMISRLKNSTAEIAVLHMYRKYSLAGHVPRLTRCSSYFPFESILRDASTDPQHFNFENISVNLLSRPSPRLAAAADIITARLKEISMTAAADADGIPDLLWGGLRQTVENTSNSSSPNSLMYLTIHARRWDVLFPHMWPKPTLYYGFSNSQLALATSPRHVRSVLINMFWPRNRPILLFTNENLPIYDVLKKDFPLLFTEQYLLNLLPESLQKFFVDNYSRYLLFVQVAKRGSRHVCTASAKFDVPCDVVLADELPRLCSSSFCPWVCHEDGSCGRDAAVANATLALGELLALLHQIGGMKTVIQHQRIGETTTGDESRHALFNGDFRNTACQAPAPLTKILCARIEFLFDIVTREGNMSLAEAFALSGSDFFGLANTPGNQSPRPTTRLASTCCAALQLSVVFLCSIGLLAGVV